MIKKETIRAYREMVEKDAEERRRKREQRASERAAIQQGSTGDQPYPRPTSGEPSDDLGPSSPPSAVTSSSDRPPAANEGVPGFSAVASGLDDRARDLAELEWLLIGTEVEVGNQPVQFPAD